MIAYTIIKPICYVAYILLCEYDVITTNRDILGYSIRGIGAIITIISMKYFVDFTHVVDVMFPD